MVVAGGSGGRGRGRPRKQQLDEVKAGSDSDEEIMEHHEPSSEISV